MNVVLTGFMGTGKSCVGRRLSETLHVPFLDVDEAIEQRSGRKIADLFSTEGEAAFRAIERQVVLEISQTKSSVIATGGGALLDARNREALEKNGTLVCLTATPATLVQRLHSDSKRPLLKGEGPLVERIERLLKERQSIYQSCPLHVATDGKSIAQVVEAVFNAIQPYLKK